VGLGPGVYGLGVYLVSLRSAHGWSTSTISGAITLYYLVGAGLIALLGRAMARFGPVATVRTGITAMGLGVAALTIVREPWQLYAAFIVMGVGWSTMSGAAINLLVAPWFEWQRGLALSLAFTGASIGGVVVGPALLWIVGQLGFTTGVLVGVTAMLALLLPVVTMVLRRPPDQEEGDAEAVPARLAASPPAAPARPWRTKGYWTISIPFAAALAAQVGFITHQVAFLTPLIGTAGAGAAVSLLALAATAGRLVLGGVVDRLDARRAACINFVLQVGGFGLLLWRPSALALYVGCIVVGLGVGNVVSLPGLLVGREFSREQFAGVVSMITATNQVAFAFAPALMGVLRDATGGYGAALALCLALDAMAAFVVMMGRRGSPAREETAMLELRPSCECCDGDLGPTSREAFICSFECTFCRDCAERVLGGTCPNCGGELVRRPARPVEKLAKFPPSTARVFKPEGCPGGVPAAERRA
jgi:hypothetical protein